MRPDVVIVTPQLLQLKKGSGQSSQGQEAANELRKEQPSLQLAYTNFLLGTVLRTAAGGEHYCAQEHIKPAGFPCPAQCLPSRVGAEGPGSVPRSPHGLPRASKIS